MAAEGDIPERELREHLSGYEGFVGLMKWGAIISLVVTFLVIFLIS